MNKINLSNLSPQAVTTFVVAMFAIVNLALQAFGISAVNVDNETVFNIVSTLFAIGASLIGMYRNFNVTDASGKAQEITDLLKEGEILVSDVDAFIKNMKERNN